jgi:hypothetical protein
MTRTAPLVVKANTTADLLALLPELAGVPVRNSLVVAPFTGKHSSRALRIALPTDGGVETARALASVVLGNLARLANCDAVAVAVYTDESFADALSRWPAFLGQVLERLHASGYHIKDAGIMTVDGWAEYFGEDALVARPLGDVDAAKARHPEGFHRPDPTALPETDPALAENVGTMLMDLLLFDVELDAFGVPRAATQTDPIDLLERALEDGRDQGPLALARLIASMQTEGAVDRTVLQIAFGPDIARRVWAKTLRLREDAKAAGCEPIDLMRESATSGLRSLDDERTGRMLTGQTLRCLGPDRLRAGADLLSRAVAHCPLPERSWVMCALGWLHWAMGLTNSAIELTSTAQRIDPRNSLAAYYRTLVMNCTPDWIFEDPAPANRSTRRRTARRR